MNGSFHISPAARAHILAVAKKDQIPPYLRISVQSGGCSGFKYSFDFTPDILADDHVFEAAPVRVLIDPVSWPFLIEGQLEFIEEMMGSYFMIKNPNAQSGCGCGSSFSI